MGTSAAEFGFTFFKIKGVFLLVWYGSYFKRKLWSLFYLVIFWFLLEL
jgi:hypothetical protein